MKQSVADWIAIHDMYALGLAEQLAMTQGELAQLHRRLQWVEPGAVGAGEAYPREAPDLDDFASLANRRVDIVAVSKVESRYVESPADPARLYGDSRVFRRIKLVPLPDDPALGTLTWITIEVLHARDGTPIVGRPVRLELPSGVQMIRNTGEDGLATFVGLAPGERVAASILADDPTGETLPTPPDEAGGLEDEPAGDEDAEASEEPATEETFEISEDSDIEAAPTDSPPPEFDELDESPDAVEIDDDDLEEEEP